MIGRVLRAVDTQITEIVWKIGKDKELKLQKL